VILRTRKKDCICQLLVASPCQVFSGLVINILICCWNYLVFCVFFEFHRTGGVSSIFFETRFISWIYFVIPTKRQIISKFLFLFGLNPPNRSIYTPFLTWTVKLVQSQSNVLRVIASNAVLGPSCVVPSLASGRRRRVDLFLSVALRFTSEREAVIRSSKEQAARMPSPKRRTKKRRLYLIFDDCPWGYSIRALSHPEISNFRMWIERIIK
jgi:hypothetical protein